MNTKRLVRISLMIALLIILGIFPPIPLGFLPVPIVLQNTGVLLAGLLLGRKDGLLSILLFFVLVLMGLPLLSGGRGGFSVFYGVTWGYIISYPIAAFLLGWLREQVKDRVGLLLLGTISISLFLIDGLGAIGMSIHTGMTLYNSFLATLTFVSGDILKSILAVIIALRIPEKEKLL